MKTTKTDLGTWKVSTDLKVLKNKVAFVTLNKCKKFRSSHIQTEETAEKCFSQGAEPEPEGHKERIPELLRGDGNTCE